MSQSQLTNSALECKVAQTGGATLVKQSFTDATITFQGATSGNKVTLTNVADPTSASQCATKNYVDGQLSGLQLGLSWKDSCTVRTTQNLDATYASGTLTASADGLLGDIDGYPVAIDDRILVMDQTNKAHNGLYKVSSLGSESSKWGLDRTSDANALSGSGDVRRASTYIEDGALYSGRGYTQSNSVSNLGTDDLVFSLFATISEVSATDGLTMSGKNIMVNTDTNRGIAIVSDKVSIVDKGVTTPLIDDGACGTAQIADSCIISSKLAQACINDPSKFSGEVVDNDALATDSVSAIKIITNGVEERHIKNSNVTRDKIADDAIDGTKIENNAVGVEHIADGAITSIKMGGGQVKSVNIGTGEVKVSNLEEACVTAPKIASGAIITSKVASQNITTALLNQTTGAEAVTTDCIRNDAINNAKLADNSVESSNIKSNQLQEIHFSDGCVSERTLGVFNSLNINGPVVATSFVAGGSTAGNTSMSLCRAVMTKVSFDNNSFPLTTDYQPLPNSTACIQFTYNDDIGATFPSWVAPFQTDGTPNYVETRIMIKYFKNDGTQSLENDAYEIDHFVFETGNDTYYPEGSHTLAVKKSALGVDSRIGKIWVEAKKGSNGSVVVPQYGDFNLICLVVADDTTATTIVY